MRFRSPPNHDPPEAIVAAIDVGSSRVACLIGALEASGGANGRGAPADHLRVLGFAHRRSAGIEAGAVVDIARAQDSVRIAVAEAERQAGLSVDAVHVAVNCGDPRSSTFNGRVALEGGIVTTADLARLDDGAESYARRGGLELLALNRIGYRLDGMAAVRNPLGLAGSRLEADHHAVCVQPGPLRNLVTLVESCHLSVAGMVPAAYASALAITSAEERQLGVACIDIGAGVTSLAGFVEGHYLIAGVLPLAGQQLTLDIARELATPLAEAERIKALYGTLAVVASDEHELVSYPSAGDSELAAHRTSKAAIGIIVRRRMRELMAQVDERLARAPAGRLGGTRIVLTGGSSSLLGLGGFAAAMLGRPVRTGAPQVLSGLVPDQSRCSFSCLVGVAMAARGATPWRRHQPLNGSRDGGYIKRVERWLLESF